MKKIIPNDLQDEIEKKSTRRLNKKKAHMKISGRSVKDLQRLIVQKSKFDKDG